MILVSACLCGVNCKYDGNNNYNEAIAALVKEGKAIPVCPEQLGGLQTPRLPQEIINGSGEDVLAGNAEVMTKEGNKTTEQFVKGAEETLKVAQMVSANTAVLKSRSPSCGCGVIYDGSFSGRKIAGNGVTAALLVKNNIKVYTEENFEEVFERIHRI